VWNCTTVQLGGDIFTTPVLTATTGADLVLADGAKFIGSAQLIRGGAILQHGSIRLEPDATLFTQVFGANPFNPIQAIAQRGEALIQSVTEALIASAGSCFGVQMSATPLRVRVGGILNGASR